ncbi:MAG: BON domain-containing protein [Myxococcota bacterium]
MHRNFDWDRHNMGGGDFGRSDRDTARMDRGDNRFDRDWDRGGMGRTDRDYERGMTGGRMDRDWDRGMGGGGRFDRDWDRGMSGGRVDRDWDRGMGGGYGGGMNRDVEGWMRGRDTSGMDFDRSGGGGYGGQYGGQYGGGYGGQHGGGTYGGQYGGYGGGYGGQYGGHGGGYGGGYGGQRFGGGQMGGGYGGQTGGGYGEPTGGGYGGGGDTDRWGMDTERGRGGFTGRGPKSYTRSDDRIKDDICDRLMGNTGIDAENIDVNVKNGEVTLTGTVRNRDDKRRIEDIVENVLGVKDVHNQIRRLGQSENLGAFGGGERNTGTQQTQQTGQKQRGKQLVDT